MATDKKDKATVEKEKEIRPFFMSYLLVYETIDKDEAAVFCFLLNRQKISGFTDTNGNYCITSRTELMRCIKGFTKWKLNEVIKSLRKQKLIRTVVTQHGLRFYVNENWESMIKKEDKQTGSSNTKNKPQVSGIQQPEFAQVSECRTHNDDHVSDVQTHKTDEVSGIQQHKEAKASPIKESNNEGENALVTGEQTPDPALVTGEQTPDPALVTGEQTPPYKEEVNVSKEVKVKEEVRGVWGEKKVSSLPSAERESFALSPHPAHPQADAAHPLPEGEGLNWGPRLKELSAILEQPEVSAESSPVPKDVVTEDVRSEKELMEMMEQIDRQKPEWEQENWFSEPTSVCDEERLFPADPTGVSRSVTLISSPDQAKKNSLPSSAESSSPENPEKDKPDTETARLAGQQEEKEVRSVKKADKKKKADSKSKSSAGKKKSAQKTTKTGKLTKAEKLAVCQEYSQSHGDLFLPDLFPDWIAIRVSKQAAETETAYRRQFAKIDQFSREAGISRGAYVNFLIDRGWKGAYALNEKNIQEAKDGWKLYLSQSKKWKPEYYGYSILTTCDIKVPYGSWDNAEGTDEEILRKADHELNWVEQARISRLEESPEKYQLPDGLLEQRKSERDRKEQNDQNQLATQYSYVQTDSSEHSDLPF